MDAKARADAMLAELFEIKHDLLTYNEVASVFRISLRTARRWVKNKILHPCRPNGWSVRFLKSDVAELVLKSSKQRR